MASSYGEEARTRGAKRKLKSSIGKAGRGGGRPKSAGQKRRHPREKKERKDRECDHHQETGTTKDDQSSTRPSR